MSNHYNMPSLPTADSPSVTIIVDEKEVRVPANTNLIEALKAVGIETPHICYHPYLPVSGNCRQCLLEIEGPRGMMLAIGCYTPVRAGMKVATPASSKKVAEARRAVQEFLLVNHPLDCPICDKAGECILQENYMLAGQAESRLSPETGKQYHANPEHAFTDKKGQHRGGKRIDLGPRIVLDEERCVQCDRCVRFMRHIAGSEQLQLAARGDHTHISTFPGEVLDHPYDRCLADICPVGALTDKNFRFKKRVWTLSKTPSVSMDDSLGANINIDHADGIVYRIVPRCNPNVNRTWLSNAAREVVNTIHSERLTKSPLSQVSELLKKESGKIAIVIGGSCLQQDIEAIQKLSSALGKAELFGGSLLPVQKADNIARSGDPVANRTGLEKFGVNTDLQSLLKRAGEFSLLLTISADLWDETPELIKPLEGISKHIALTPFNKATAKRAILALGVRHWIESSGTMINCNGLEQFLKAVSTRESELVEQIRTIADKLV